MFQRIPSATARHALAAVIGGLLCMQAALADPTASNANDPKAYRKDAARHIYALNKDQIYKGKLPPMVHAVVVAEVDVDSAGQVRGVNMIRTPSHAPDVTARVKELIHAASPLPAPQRMGGVKYMLVSHNTRMGAAKGAMLIAEYLAHTGYIGK